MRGKTKQSDYKLSEVLLGSAVLALPIGAVAAVVGYFIGGAQTGFNAGMIGAACAFFGLLLLIAVELLFHGGQGQVDDHGYRHGAWVWHSANKLLARQVQYNHGDKHGREMRWHPNGEQAFSAEWVEGKLHGVVQVWDEEGRLRHEAEYAEGKKHGAAVNYNDAGGTVFQGEFDQGRPHGAWEWWRENGQPWVEAHYRHGAAHGAWIEWDERGHKVREAEFIAGVQHGRARRYFTDQTLLLTDEATSFPPPVLQPSRGSRMFWTLIVAVVLVGIVRDYFLLVPLAVFLLAITVHELGHFVTAKLMGIPIKTFRVGIGPRLGSFHAGSTAYEFHLLPLMGYVGEYQLRKPEWEHARKTLRARRKKEPAPDYPHVDPASDPENGHDLVSPPRRIVYFLGGVAFNFLSAAAVLWAISAAAGPDDAASPTKGPWKAVALTGEMAWTMLENTPQMLAPLFESETYARNEPGAIFSISSSTRRAVDQAARRDAEIARREAQETGRRPAESRLGSAGLVVMAQAAVYFVAFSIVLLWFNLLPLPPLDGFHVTCALVEILLGRTLARKLMQPLRIAGIFVIVFLILAGLFFVLRDFILAIIG